MILYSTLFRGQTSPGCSACRPGRNASFCTVQEAVLLSSWAFLLLASPMLLAYGAVGSVPWYYYAMLAPALLAFTYIPAAAGAILCLAIVRWLPRGRFLLLALVAVAVLVVAAAYAASLVTETTADFFTPVWIQEMLGRLRVTENRWLPSWWLTCCHRARRDNRKRDVSRPARLQRPVRRLLALGSPRGLGRRTAGCTRGPSNGRTARPRLTAAAARANAHAPDALLVIMPRGSAAIRSGRAVLHLFAGRSTSSAAAIQLRFLPRRLIL